MYIFGRGVTIREQMGLYKETINNSCVICNEVLGACNDDCSD